MIARFFGQRNAAEPESRLDPGNAAERRTLVLVLGINLLQVALAGGVGLAADSSALAGTALDSLSDAAVYIISLYAVGRTVVAKSRAASLSGVLLFLLAIVLLVDVMRRFLTGSDPIGLAMIVVAVINTATNFVAMQLLSAHRKSGVHLNASWIFTANDMLINAGIVASGIAVMLLDSPLPDLVIGVIVAAIVIRSGWEILQDARSARRTDDEGRQRRV